MKLKFFVLRRRRIIAFILIVLTICIFCGTFFSLRASTSPSLAVSIVIDAGHGGIDGGCVGAYTNVKESDLNLSYAKTLQALCENFGMKTIMTRPTEEGLYSPFAKNKKRSEMEKREEIIKNSNADLFVSIHMNSFANHDLSGAQIFYKNGNDQAKAFADCITKSLKKDLGKIRGESKVGDYYVLNCNGKAGVLIECGYLSNREEELLLQKKDYEQKFCQSVFEGILGFLKM